VIARLVGAPVDDHRQISAWVDELSQSEWLTNNRGPHGDGLQHGFPDFYRYLLDLVTERREPGATHDDFLAQLISTEIDGIRLNDNEILAIVAFMLQAGSDTTRHLLANIILELARDRELLDRLAADLNAIPDFVEEMLRLHPPATVIVRKAASDSEFQGCPVPRGATTLLSLSAANRDPAVFPDPDAVRLDRPNAMTHLAFGAGRHICPGAALARMEAIIATEVLVTGVREIVLAGDWSYRMVPVVWADGPVDVIGRMTPR
jgi:cytochrome P450